MSTPTHCSTPYVGKLLSLFEDRSNNSTYSCIYHAPVHSSSKLTHSGTQRARGHTEQNACVEHAAAQCMPETQCTRVQPWTVVCFLRMCVQVLNAKFGFHMCEHERHLANSNACRGKKASTMFFAAHTYTFSVFNAEAYSLASHVQTPPFRETIDCYDETFSLVQRHAACTLAASLFIFAWQRY